MAVFRELGPLRGSHCPYWTAEKTKAQGGGDKIPTHTGVKARPGLGVRVCTLTPGKSVPHLGTFLYFRPLVYLEQGQWREKKVPLGGIYSEMIPEK